MSFQLTQRDLADAIRQLATDRLTQAEQALAPDNLELAEGIHDARKRLKETRALVRLFSAALGSRAKQENRALRDIARLLSSSRDAHALLTTFDELATAPGSGVPLKPEAVRAIHERLEQRYRTVTAHVSLDSSLAAARTALAQARERASTWKLKRNGFAAVAPGLKRSYRIGRSQLKLLHDPQGQIIGSDTDFHEWRKRVKDQWYQTKLLRPLWHEGLGGRQKALKSLATLLGDDHDLSVLRSTLAEEPALFGKPSLVVRLDQLAAAKQLALRQEALPLGLRLYAEKPRAYLDRMEIYWQLWNRSWEQ
jgi:CHAD domain-containing protein